MKISIETDEKVAENEICLHVKKITETVGLIAEKLESWEKGCGDEGSGTEDEFASMIIGYQEENVSFLKPENIVRIFSLQKKVYAVTYDNKTENNEYELNLRLYQIEEMMDKTPFKKFIRISNTDIVNFDYLKTMDMSLNGNIVMNLTDGQRVFVSRRYMKEIKTKLRIK